MNWHQKVKGIICYQLRKMREPLYTRRKLTTPCTHKAKCAATYKSSPPWDIMFFGTDEFALQSLMALHNEQQTSGVVGQLNVVSVSLKKIVPAVRRYCLRERIPLHDWPLEVPRGVYDLGIVASFGHLIPAKIINAFPMGILNIHGSLLPRWRGAAPTIHAVLNNDLETGITIMKIEPHRFDVGKIVSRVAVPISWDTKSGVLTKHLAAVGAQELISVLQDLPQKLQAAVIQSEDGVTKAPKVSEATSKIQWNCCTCSNIQAMYRAFDDYLPLWTIWHGTPVRLRDMVMQEEWSPHYLDVGKTAVTKVPDFKENNGRDLEKIKENIPHNSGCVTEENVLERNDKWLLNKCHITNTTEADRIVNVKKNCEQNESYAGNLNLIKKLPPGSVVYNKKLKVVSVLCLDGWVNFRQIVIKGRKAMSAHDFYNGFIGKVPKDHHRFD
ncbi:methionyl-tRNA formyltransferase, mitochondrial-like [Homarus americanus]|uniref:Methionyl-tRNA formyltransferase-like n=1 Tax=Homarus americanus TaxID=6706 RepID=A0A8J5MV35_HOMAM|nr:methionyl-tRNA formyltransferase, mitochondrial-like [Homarus americanus]KAG7164721.1 Methionyl-tRNA formyltransferase-like [Homarus americanus]